MKHQMIKLKQMRLGLLIVGLALGISSQTSQAAYYVVNGATGSNGESILSNGNLEDDGDNRTITWITKGSVPKPSFFYTGAYSGRSLKLYCDDRSSDDAGRSQKTEYPFVDQNDARAFPVAKEAGSTNYYTGFAVRLGDKDGNYFDSIRERLLFYQCWQGRGTGGYNPPMSMQLLRRQGDGTQKLQIWVKNTTHSPTNESSRITFGTWNMDKETWYKFVVTARPDWPNSGATRNGYLKVWMKRGNGSESTIVNQNNYEWGYKPSFYNGKNGPKNIYRYVTSTISVYRDQQRRKHMVNFDNVRHSGTKSDANP